MLARSLLVLCNLTVSAMAGAPTFQRGVNISHWLAQHGGERPYGAMWFDAEDVGWIAEQGFDHIRVPVEGRVWLREDGGLDEGAVQPFAEILPVARARGLGVILDMHFLPGASFQDQGEGTLFTDPEKLKVATGLWRAVAARFADADAGLRFELLNEPVAQEHGQLTPVFRVFLAAIRETNPQRVVYWTSNKWSGFATAEAVELPEDPNVAVTFHYYEPFVFTHQRASWVKLDDRMPPVTFPGRVPELAGAVPEGHWMLGLVGMELTEEAIGEDFAKLAAWAKASAPGREIHIGEFGAYERADDAERARWVGTVRTAAERHGFGWAVWDYQGGFAVRAADGKGTPILGALLPDAPAAKTAGR